MKNKIFSPLENLEIKLNKRNSADWVEEAYCTDELSGELSGEALGISVNKKRLYLLAIFIFSVLVLLLSRAFYLQIIKLDHYRELSDSNRIRQEVIKTNRGIIKDRNYTALVYNEPYFNIFIIPANLPENPEEERLFVNTLGKILKKDESEFITEIEEISERDSRYYNPQLIADGVLLSDVWPILIMSKRYPSIYIEVDSYRRYVSSEENLNSLSHILGYEGKISPEELDIFSEKGYLLTDKIGKVGLEDSYEDYLRGIHGKKFWEVDALLRPQKILYEQEKVIGDDLILTIDLNYQRKLEEIIKEKLEEFNLTKGGAILMNPNNGEILAMVSLPAYDDNDFALGIDSETYSTLLNDPDIPLYNRMVSGEYPPGSTFKLVVGAAALEEGIVDDSNYFISTGGIKIDQWFFPDWRAGGHGKTNIYKAIAESVNTYFYMVGGGDEEFTGLGVNRLARYADKFNLGRKLGIDLPNESSGFVPTPSWKEAVKDEEWYIGDTYHMAIGQGDMLVTPLQVAEYTAFFANDGKLFVPHLVRERHNEQTNLHEKIDPVLIRDNIISKENIEIMQKALRQTVTEGSGKSLDYLDLTVAGKTGTAQWNLEEDPHAWWTCYAPYENPEIVLTVFVEEGIDGTKTALPIANEFLYWWSLNR